MSEQQVEGQQTTQSANPSRINKDGVIIELVHFREGGALQGFSFYQKSFKNLNDAVSHFSAIGENGEELVVGLINKAIAANARNKATSKLPDEDEINKRRQKDDMILITSDEAFKYVPGERDAYSISGLNKKLNEVRTALKDLRAKGVEDTNEEIVALKQEGKDLVEKIRVAQEKLGSEFE